MMRRRAIVGTAVVEGAAYAAGHHSATKSTEQQQTDAQQNEQTDVVAGVTIFAMLMLQGMADGLTGVAPVAGLYPAVGAMVGSALFWEFTTSDDWYNGIFRDPGGHNTVPNCC